ncbi:DUF2156 domain-containing protein [Patescibacteria group bacterium]|nr:DUF2156 domain-containing protein [Patescibacteria group bacterium]MBU2158784.1 DUF2156 domain-containing protein [Patescibacteria group bacterium]MBU2220664.1 DUF2156 domain-containing protein [Patescibacteria group bacterium]
MIAEFPDFKKIEVSDKEEIDAYTKEYPPYSDFEFGSLWAWDVKEEMAISILNGNLVVKFTDYTTGKPFLAFLGKNMVNETAGALLSYSVQNGFEETMHLIPETVAKHLDRDLFLVEESRDHFDYVCDINYHIEYPGKNLKSQRNLLKVFKDTSPDFEQVSLKMETKEAQQEVASVLRRWTEGKEFISDSEAFAYERFVSAAESLSYSAVGIRVAGELVAFHIVSLPPGNCANALFGKADTAYRGVYAALDHVVARDLIERNYTHMNIQQDLGIDSLRAAKLSLHPSHLLKKYSVSSAEKG